MVTTWILIVAMYGIPMFTVETENFRECEDQKVKYKTRYFSDIQRSRSAFYCVPLLKSKYGHIK